MLQKKQAKLDEAAAAVADQQATFLWKTIQRFLRVLRPLGRTEQPKKAKLEFCERMLELLIDLEVRERFDHTIRPPTPFRCVWTPFLAPPSLIPPPPLRNQSCLPTRRFFNLLLDSTHVVVRCDMSPLPSMPEGSLFGQVGMRAMGADSHHLVANPPLPAPSSWTFCASMLALKSTTFLAWP